MGGLVRVFWVWSLVLFLFGVCAFVVFYCLLRLDRT